MSQRPYIPIKPNIPTICLMSKPSTFVVLNQIGDQVGTQYLEQGFALTPNILLPEAVSTTDLSQPSLTRIVDTLSSTEGILSVDGVEHKIGDARLVALKEQLIEKLSSCLLCEACPLNLTGQCRIKFIVDTEQESLGIFPDPIEGVKVTTLKKPGPPFLNRNQLSLAV